jgi:hypothetical protein
MTTSAIDNLSPEQQEAFESLISEKEELIHFFSFDYQWWVAEVEILDALEEPNLHDRLSLYKELIERINILTNMINGIVGGNYDPMEQLAIYTAAYSLGNFLEDEFWEATDLD